MNQGPRKKEGIMKFFTQSTTIMGTVTSVNPSEFSFTLRCRSGDGYLIFVNSQTVFGVPTNLDELNRDRFPEPENFNLGPDWDRKPSEYVRKYLYEEAFVVVQGIYSEHDEEKRFDARYVTLMHWEPGKYLFEETHWWLNQITRLAEEWLDDLFGDRRTYALDDFAELYRTNLNILGLPVGDNNTQECATLSRLIYGLSSAYLLTGQDRFRLAAAAGIRYQRDTFRSLSHDGTFCIWNFGKRKTDDKYKQEVGAKIIMGSLNPDDYGTIPLYEQIYALAGMAQFYRISMDWEVLEDIERTINTFQIFYLDSQENYPFSGLGGYFSHLDYPSLRPDVQALGDNRLRKNWNSIGDHIPAYLVNLILALDPPTHESERLLRTCRKILDTTARLILEKFPDPNSHYVNERFHADWTPDHNWRWQRNRAVVGHNLKIAWNLTRVANYYRYLAHEENLQGDKSEAQQHEQLANDFLALAQKLGDTMAIYGLDQVRGGCFDVVERKTTSNMPLEFTWGNTKDFWQQEQGILAYLILHGATGDFRYLSYAREMVAFWNIFFLDHDNRGIFFRVTAEGRPAIEGAYGQKGSHSVAGYHSFELNYLAHIYTRSFVNVKKEGSNFCLYFCPEKTCGRTMLNVLPDFFAPGTMEIASIKVNGIPRGSFSPSNFQLQLDDNELGSQVVVEFRPIRRD
jgi:mannose/cellobiose epimerase-like protein (N-acyl-D-glucosamine 2-epimerase family)